MKEDVIGIIAVALMVGLGFWLLLTITDTDRKLMDRQVVVVAKEYVPERTRTEEYRPTPRYSPQIVEITDPEEWIIIAELANGKQIERKVRSVTYKLLQIGDTVRLGDLLP